MHHFLNQLRNAIMPIIGIAVFAILFVAGVIVFSYLLIFIAAFGFLIFCIAFIRAKLLQRKMRKQYNKQQPKPSGGRIIEYDEIEKKD